MSPRPSLAIIGTGIAGLGCAHFLHRQFDLTLFDPNDPAVRVEKPEMTDEARDAKRNFKDWERPKMTQ
jgi:UDP-N-acetylmuramoylalanine-D-glutamate ligase